MNESWHLYLTGSRLFVRRAHGLFRRHVEHVTELAWDRPTLAALSMPGTPHRAERPLYVYVSSSMLRWTTVSLQLKDPTERLLAARACLQERYGIEPADWAVQLQETGVLGYTIACALRKELLEGLRGLGRTNGLRLASVRPYVQAVWSTFSSKHRWPATLVTVEPDAFTVIAPGSGKETCISSFCHQRQSGLIEREITRLALAGAAAVGQDVHIAVSDQLRHMLPNGASQATPMCKASYLQHDLYCDFRDLAFCSEVPA
jgi:hypothetical protein